MDFPQPESRSAVENLKFKLDQLILLIYRQLYGSRLLAPFITNQFYKLYYASSRRTWNGNTHWLGTPILKNPLDMWVYQELLYRVQPDAIVECGTFNGGSALYFASLCDLLGKGKILSIDIDDREGRPQHERITYYSGSSISDETLNIVQEFLADSQRILVILDSDHSRDHVLAEMRLYGPLVTEGSYMIVEDGCVNGHPMLPFHGPGPLEAIRLYLKEDSTFEIDTACEKFYFTFNPSGYLKKLPDSELQSGKVAE